MAAAMFHVKHTTKRDRTGPGGGLEGVWRGPRGGLARGCALLAAAALAACSSPDEIARETGLARTEVPAPPTPPIPEQGKVAFTDNAAEGEATRDFAYSWPAAVAAVPELAARFTAERDTLLADQKAEWSEAIAEFAGQDCVACARRSLDKGWEVVADTPRFLSLSATIYEYAGGAHGNSGFAALVWDRETRAAIDPKAMFRSAQALQDALGGPWCKALTAEKKRRLGDDYGDDGFFPCPPIDDLTVLAGSSNGQRFDRIGLLAAPYVAGSYAEGAYEVTVPVTPAVLSAVRPEYRSAFAPGT